MSIWNEFDEGLESGDRIGGQIRNARAYREGGLDAVGEAAGRVGDLQGMETAREMQRRQVRFADERMQNAYERMEQIAPWARNVVRVTRNMDPQRAGAFLSRPDIRQRFLDWGFSEEQLAAGIAGLTSTEIDPNTGRPVRELWADELDTQFQQHQNPEWKIVQTTDGAQIGGVDPNSGQWVEGGTAPAGTGAEWRPVTDAEAAQWGLPAGSVWDVNTRTGERRERHRPNAPRAGQGMGYYPDDGYDYEAD